MVRHAVKQIVGCFIKYLSPPPDIRADKWAEENVILTEDHGERPGPLRFSLTPWLRDPIEWMARCPEITDITLMWGSQLGKTLAVMVSHAYRLVVLRRSILMTWPSTTLARAYSDEKWQPLVDACEPLRELKSQDKDRYRKLDMNYSGPWLNIVGTGAATNISSRSRGDVTQEECDKYKEASEKETSPSKNADKRAKSFTCPKRIKSSTPTTPTGTVNVAYEAGSQSKFEMGCPHCGEYIELLFSQIKWDQDAKRDGDWDMTVVKRSAHYECQLCGETIYDAHKTIMYRKTRWVDTNPTAPGSHKSCNVPSWYAAWTDCSFGNTAVKFLTAKKDFSMQDFDTNERGLPYEIEARKLEWEKLYERREVYDQPIPDRVAMLIGFCDVQDDWLEFGIIGFGEKTENWLVEHRIIEGDPAQQEVWDDLAYHITRPRRLPLDWFGIDHGGHFPQGVQDFVAKMNRSGYRFVRAMKGDNKPWSQIIGRIGWSQKHRPRCRIYFTGTDNAKRVLLTMLQVEPPDEAGKSKRGLCHFPEWFSDEMAQQICAEQMQSKKVRGVEVKEWRKTRERNEMLDIYVGCYAGFKRVGEQRFKNRIIDMRKRLESPPSKIDEAKVDLEGTAEESSGRPRRTTGRRTSRRGGRNFATDI